MYCFFFSLKKYDNNPARNSFDKSYMPLVEIKCFSVLTDIKLFFDQSLINK